MFNRGRMARDINRTIEIVEVARWEPQLTDC